MSALILTNAVALPSSAIADSCIAMEGRTLVNGCQTCLEVTAHALRPQAEQAPGSFAGVSRTVRLEAGAREGEQARSAIRKLVAGWLPSRGRFVDDGQEPTD